MQTSCTVSWVLVFVIFAFAVLVLKSPKIAFSLSVEQDHVTWAAYGIGYRTRSCFRVLFLCSKLDASSPWQPSPDQTSVPAHWPQCGFSHPASHNNGKNHSVFIEQLQEPGTKLASLYTLSLILTVTCKQVWQRTDGSSENEGFCKVTWWPVAPMENRIVLFGMGDQPALLPAGSYWDCSAPSLSSPWVARPPPTLPANISFIF